MSLPLFNVPGDILREKVVTATHDRSNCEGSFKGAATEFKVEPALLSDILHPSLCTGPGSSTGSQSECGNFHRDLEELQALIEPDGSCGIDLLGSYFLEEHIWNGPTWDSIKTDFEESDSESEGSESPVEELVSSFVPQICISENLTQGVKENKIEEFSNIKPEKNKVGEISDHVKEYFLSKGNIAAPSNLVAVLPSSVRAGNSESPPQGCEKAGHFTERGSTKVTKLKSAVRGGYEKLGLGPRPRFHVTWAPDVYDPPCTSASHTVLQNHRRHHSKKTEHKHRHKGKVSHSDSRKKLEKKLSRKLRREGCISRTPAVPFQKVTLTEFTVLPYDEHTLKSVRLSSKMLPQTCPLSGMLKLGDRRLAKLDTRMPLPWHVQPHRVCT